MYPFCISIHAPVKGATSGEIIDVLIGSISIHAPVKGATPSETRPCKCPGISIHAPVKGATFIGVFVYMRKSISIHAPVKGATRNTILSDYISCHFNPRTREGCDLGIHFFHLSHMGFQSTHP